MRARAILDTLVWCKILQNIVLRLSLTYKQLFMVNGMCAYEVLISQQRATIDPVRGSIFHMCGR